MRIKKRSDWTYGTNRGIDIGLLIASFQKGSFEITRPSEKATVYISAAGVSEGLGLPASITWSTEEMPSVGDIFVSTNVHAPDLEVGDFDGLCCIISGSSILFGMGGSTSVLFFGIPWSKVPKQIARGIASNIFDWKSYVVGPAYPIYKVIKFFSGKGSVPNAIDPLVNEAKGVLITSGMIVGPSFGASGSVLFGYISSESSVMPWEIQYPNTPEDIEVHYEAVTPDQSIIRVPGDVLFGFDKDWVGSGRGGAKKADATLSVVSFFMNLLRPRTMFTEGHTDSVGTPSYNQQLSDRRAKAVRTWLLSKGKLVGIPITPVGFGLTKPVADNRTSEGREKNRRVEFRIYN